MTTSRCASGSAQIAERTSIDNSWQSTSSAQPNRSTSVGVTRWRRIWSIAMSWAMRSSHAENGMVAAHRTLIAVINSVTLAV